MAIYKCTLPIPPSVNALYGGGSKQKRFKSKEYKQWLALVGNLPLPDCGCICEAVKIEYRFYWPDMRVRDTHNFLKAVDDYLVSQGIIEDDKWTILNKSSTENYLDKDNPRINIFIDLL